MLANFILPETTIREAGTGPAMDLGDNRGSLLLLTLGITRIIEQESLDISIWGSADGTEWEAKPLLSFPQKFYCGTYQIMLDLRDHANLHFLRVKYQAHRWGKGDPKPLFGAYVFVQEFRQQLLTMTAA